MTRNKHRYHIAPLRNIWWEILDCNNSLSRHVAFALAKVKLECNIWKYSKIDVLYPRLECPGPVE